MFTRYGVPDVVVSDNGPQFDSAEFTTFAKKWGFEHITSSPCYPQSNGKAENAVKTVKRLFTKCRASGQSEYLALLDWCNTLSEGIGTSSAQHFFSCDCKTAYVWVTPPILIFHSRRHKSPQCTETAPNNSTVTARPSPSSPLHLVRQFDCDFLVNH